MREIENEKNRALLKAAAAESYLAEVINLAIVVQELDDGREAARPKRILADIARSKTTSGNAAKLREELFTVSGMRQTWGSFGIRSSRK